MIAIFIIVMLAFYGGDFVDGYELIFSGLCLVATAIRSVK